MNNNKQIGAVFLFLISTLLQQQRPVLLQGTQSAPLEVVGEQSKMGRGAPVSHHTVYLENFIFFSSPLLSLSLFFPLEMKYSH